MTCDAQIELMKALKPGMTEYESEAIVEYVFKKNIYSNLYYHSICSMQ